MSRGELLATARGLFLVELAIAGVFAVLVIVLGALSRRRAEITQRRLTRARGLLGTALERGIPAPDTVAALAAMPWDIQLTLMLEFGQALEGEWRSRLGQFGVLLGADVRAEALCGSRFWWRRLLGARVMTALDHDSPSVRALLGDPHPSVRAQALTWAAGRTDERVIEELVRHLADTEWLCRFTVQDSLLRLGRPAAAALARFLSSDRRAGLEDGLTVARGLAQAVLLDPVLRLCRHPEDSVRTRATAVLGVLGGERTVDMLVERLADGAAPVRAAAAHATGEVGYWHAAPALARLLGDPSYPVRREAALALRRLGSVGIISLRRARADRNAFAGDMARHALDLPESAFHRVAS